MSQSYDTVVIGGGPAGATVASLLRKYDPDHRVLVLERETFPREHVGESQLPVIGQILEEMGCWDKIEAADFPIKVGATYRWGTTPDLWHFNFVPNGELHPEPRPAKYAGQRLKTAFQVDRGVYDKILLDHARELGAEVREATKVTKVHTDGDRVTGLEINGRETIEARHYVDGSGAVGLLRRAMGVEVDSPTSLRNIAIWDYWQNAAWAEELGVGGTRVQVMSLGYGWIWFIPLGPTRTSVGLIVPASYYKESGQKPAELYARALQEEARIRGFMEGATSEGKLQTTNDWSFLASRLTGENWYLVGDACGFADPILAAGMTLAHAGAREVAYCILEERRGELDPAWIREAYNDGHRRRILQHIRFADYWYSVNSQFSDLVAFTSEIARDAGLSLSPDEAFQWLGTGGFANDGTSTASVGTFSVAAVKQMAKLMSQGEATWALARYNELRLELAGTQKVPFAVFEEGRIYQESALVGNGKRLPLVGPFLTAYRALQQERDVTRLIPILRAKAPRIPGAHPDHGLMECIQALEALIAEGWVKGKVNKKRPHLQLAVDDESPLVQFAK